MSLSSHERHGGPLDAYYWVKEASLKRLYTIWFQLYCWCSVAKLCLTLRPRGLQHTRLSCPSSNPGAYSNSCPLRQWCHPTISSSVIPFSSCLQSFPASGSFQMSQFFALGGQSIRASASVLLVNILVNIQDWFLLVCLDWFALLAMWHSGKDKTMETVKKISGCQRKGWISRSQRIVHTVKLFFMELHW